MKFTLELTAEELRILADALSAAPFKMVAALINNIQQQVTKQQPPEKSQDSVN